MSSGRVVLAALLLCVSAFPQPSVGELVLLDAPVALGPARLLHTGRYAPLQTAAADAARAAIDARVALVRQPPGGGGCPDYAAARGVRGALVLETRVYTADCSLGTRVALAAAAGALGWLHVPARPPAGAVGEPGFQAYFLAPGDAELLATAPPAVDIGQASAGLAWLLDALEAGAEPRARLWPRAKRDAWASTRGSDYFMLWQAVVALSTLAVLELSLCRLYTLVAQPAPIPVNDLRGSFNSRGTTDGGGSSAWHIGPVVLVTCAASAALRLLYVLGDPLWAFGRFPFRLGLALLVTPAALGLLAQLVNVVYTFESLDAAGGLETLMLARPRHKAVVLLGGAGLVGVEAAILALPDPVQGGTLLLAFALVGCPAALALAYGGLAIKARRLLSGAGRVSFERKLRCAAVGNALIAAAALPLYWLHAAPAPMMVLSCVVLLAFDCLAYSQCERIAPVGARAVRGPLRALVELARRSARGLRVQRVRSLRQIIPSSRAESASEPTTTSIKPAHHGAAAGTEHVVDIDAADGLGGMPAPVLEGEDVACTHLALGVSLACLRDFALEQRVAETSSTADVVARICELTAGSRRSYAEELAHASASNGLPAVGKATVFVSHAQACNFAKLLAALRAYVDMYRASEVDTYFWLDLMCIRQHEVAADVMRIGDVITAIGRVAMVLDPWHKPLCLERVWCLYEIAQTVGTAADSARADEHETRRRRTLSRLSVSSSDRASPPANEPISLVRRSASEGDLLMAAIAEAAAAGPLCEPDGASSFPSTSQPPRRKTRGERVRSLVMPAESATDQAVEAPRRRRTRMESLSALVKPFHADADGPSVRPPRVRLFLTMSPRERLKLVYAARTSLAQIERALTQFDCRTAGAFVSADRQMILAYIAAKFAPPPEPAPAHSATPDGAQNDALALAETAAYDNFNARVRLAIRKAFASFSHLPTEHITWGSPTLRNGGNRDGFNVGPGLAGPTTPPIIMDASVLEESETTAVTAADLTEVEKRDVERLLAADSADQASALLL